jgi:hypothetical protein
MVACRTGGRTILGKLIISGRTGLFFIAGPAKGNIPRDRLPVLLSPGYAVMHASRRCFNLQADDHLNPDLVAEQPHIVRAADAALPPR